MLPLSGLQHYLYCPRQCALIHLEQVWAENLFTAEGRVLHERAHSGSDEHRVGEGVTIARSLPVRSSALGISGQCDIVEFHRDGRIVPVEYKRGKPKDHSADEVQICAQAMCLEEMMRREVLRGFLFYGKRRRRTEVNFDDVLRELTVDTAQRFHELFDSRETPPSVYESRKCGACSLIDLCQPKLGRKGKSASAWFDQVLADETKTEPHPDPF